MSPSGTSASSRSSTSACSRRGEDGAAPVDADDGERSRSAFFSTISCAIRTSVRRMSSLSRTTFSARSACPSWPHGTGLKEPTRRRLATAAAAARRSSDADASPVSTGSGSRSSQRTSSGSPRSGNGSSTASKSRGTTVSGKIARASSRTLAREVAGREVHEREHAHLGLVGDRRGLARGRVAGLRARSASSSRKVASWTSRSASWAATRQRVGGRGVAGDDDLAPGAGRAHDLLGDDAVDGLAALQAAEVGARGRRRGAARALGSKRPGRSSSTSA